MNWQQWQQSVVRNVYTRSQMTLENKPISDYSAVLSIFGCFLKSTSFCQAHCNFYWNMYAFTRQRYGWPRKERCLIQSTFRLQCRDQGCFVAVMIISRILDVHLLHRVICVRLSDLISYDNFFPRSAQFIGWGKRRTLTMSVHETWKRQPSCKRLEDKSLQECNYFS